MASSSHTIRLHGPWQCELFKSPGDAAEILVVKLPVEWDSFLRDRTFDSMAWTRNFGCPSNLGARERVELVVSNLCARVMVELNDAPIEPIARTDAGARFDLTDRLQIRNRLVLKVPASSPDIAATACPFEHVYLEILTDSDQT